MKATMIRIGNFFFRYRNRLFPIIIIALYCIAPPPRDLFSADSLGHGKDIAALALAFSGLFVRGIVIGYAYIKRGGLNKQVYADTLVTGGMFSLCRNPLYVGNMLIYTGVFMMHGDPLVLIAGTGLYLFIYQCIIYAEEAFLTAKFGAEYSAYCANVPRWIPRVHKFGAATQGMNFDLRRVILKDYTTITTTTIALTLTKAYQYLALPNSAQYEQPLVMLALVLLACGVWVGGVRYIKKGRIGFAPAVGQ